MEGGQVLEKVLDQRGDDRAETCNSLYGPTSAAQVDLKSNSVVPNLSSSGPKNKKGAENHPFHKPLK